MAELLRLPPRPFLYTIDQVCSLVGCTEAYLKSHVAFFTGRTVTGKTSDDLVFMNIAKPDDAPEWRCEERELVRWLRRKGFKAVSTS